MSNIDVNEILVRPLITEKNTLLGQIGRYAFEVDGRANKPMVKDAVQKIFKVDVLAVNIVNMKPKTRRVGTSIGQTKTWKKAIVTLAAGQRIEIFEGV